MRQHSVSSSKTSISSRNPGLRAFSPSPAHREALNDLGHCLSRIQNRVTVTQLLNDLTQGCDAYRRVSPSIRLLAEFLGSKTLISPEGISTKAGHRQLWRSVLNRQTGQVLILRLADADVGRQILQSAASGYMVV